MRDNILRIFIVFSLFFVSIDANAQVLQPARWNYAISKSEVKAGEEVDLIFHAVIDKDWYLYSSDFDPELGPIVTTFSFKPHPSYTLVGKIKPIGAK